METRAIALPHPHAWCVRTRSSRGIPGFNMRVPLRALIDSGIVEDGQAEREGLGKARSATLRWTVAIEIADRGAIRILPPGAAALRESMHERITRTAYLQVYSRKIPLPEGHQPYVMFFLGDPFKKDTNIEPGRVYSITTEEGAVTLRPTRLIRKGSSGSAGSLCVEEGA